MGFSKFYKKSMHRTFLVSCMKLKHHKDLKLSQNFFLRKILFWVSRAEIFLINRELKSCLSLLQIAVIKVGCGTTFFAKACSATNFLP